MSIKKKAATDAARWARAEMFFGEGAGTRRKLLDAEIYQKGVDLGEKYQQAFQDAYAKQDFAKHAIAAAKERQRLDHVNVISKNARALIRGDLRHVSPLVYVAIAAGYYAHATGYDKVLLKRAKVEYQASKRQVKTWWNANGGSVYNINVNTPVDIDKPYGGLGS